MSAAADITRRSASGCAAISAGTITGCAAVGGDDETAQMSVEAPVAIEATLRRREVITLSLSWRRRHGNRSNAGLQIAAIWQLDGRQGP